MPFSIRHLNFWWWHQMVLISCCLSFFLGEKRVIRNKPEWVARYKVSLIVCSLWGCKFLSSSSCIRCMYVVSVNNGCKLGVQPNQYLSLCMWIFCKKVISCHYFYKKGLFPALDWIYYCSFSLLSVWRCVVAKDSLSVLMVGISNALCCCFLASISHTQDQIFCTNIFNRLSFSTVKHWLFLNYLFYEQKIYGFCGLVLWILHFSFSKSEDRFAFPMC